MIPEELREELLAVLDTEIWNGYVQPNFETPNPSVSWQIAELVLDSLVSHLEDRGLKEVIPSGDYGGDVELTPVADCMNFLPDFKKAEEVARSRAEYGLVFRLAYPYKSSIEDSSKETK